MSGSHYGQLSPRSPAGNEGGESGSPSAKRRKVGKASPTFLSTTSQAEAGPSRQRAAPRRIPSDTPSDGARPRAARTDEDDEKREAGEGVTDESGSSSGWTYELVVVQHPQRARACGFGDKDRRPLSPPPILRLHIRTAKGHLVDPSIVPIHFLLLMVDLWSADLTQERNVVMHPAANTRQPSPAPPAQSLPTAEDHRSTPRPNTAEDRPPTSHYPSSGWGWSDQQSPKTTTGKSTGPSPHTRVAGATRVQDPLPVPASPLLPSVRPASSPNPSQIYPSSLRPSSSASHRPYTAPTDTLRPLRDNGSTQRVGSFNLPSLASITDSLPRDPPPYMILNSVRDSSGRPTTATTTDSGRPSGPYSDWTRPSWSTESTRPTTGYSAPRTSNSTWYTSSFSSDAPERDQSRQVTGWPPPRPSSSGYAWGGPSNQTSPHVDPLSLRPSTSGQPWSAVSLSDAQSIPSSSPNPPPRQVPLSLPPLVESVPEDDPSRPGSIFSRVLVGSVCAMCQRLQDEDGKEGLFFFTHDLAVRTEGVFRLKFSLTNLEPLVSGPRSQGQGRAVLSQVYSEPFTVYSAKKFPGVVPTTKLTTLFAAQNVRLPTRQKRGGGGGAGPEGEGEEGEEDI